MKKYELNLTLTEREMYVLYTMMFDFLNDNNKNSPTWKALSSKIQKSIENKLAEHPPDLPKSQEREYEVKFIKE